jgi:hypothetical protein
VQRVGHDDPIEWGQVKRPCEVGLASVEGDAGEAAGHFLGLLAEGAAVAVYRINNPIRSNEVGQCQRKRPTAGAKIGPYPTRSRETFLQEEYVILMVH